MSERLNAAKAAINEIFGDTSVPPEETLEALQELQEDIEVKIDAIQSDLRKG